MSISLRKGQNINLTKDNPNLKHLKVGLGWDTNKYDGGYDFDLDAETFLLGANGKVTNDKDFVFYGNLVHPSGSVRSLGDNRTGSGSGDDEIIEVDLAKVPMSIEHIMFTVSIYQAEQRNQTFGQVSHAFIHVDDSDTGRELARFDLTEDYSIETAIVVGELYRSGSDWKFKAVGSGYQEGFIALCRDYGIEASYD